ncbi:MAG: 6-bladed beta-propeller [Dysgonamonadaceae bacterium]|jgi:hypothetical protein|nr:6-bladed beta-propeller [Dysgonamonadaceae bacterium]
MNQTIYCIGILVVFFLLSCNHRKKLDNTVSDSNCKIIKIDLQKSIEAKSIADIASSIQVRILEEDKKNPIGVIDEMLITNTNIYILDRQRAKTLFVYERDGHFFNAIRHIGNGPGEYSAPRNFDLEKGTGNLVILDSNQRKFLYYTKDNRFLSTMSFKGTYCSSFCTTNDSLLILDTGNSVSDADDINNYIVIINKNGEKITELLPIPDYLEDITLSPRNPLQKINDTVIFLPSASNKVYNIANNQVSTRYEFDFGTLWANENFFKNQKHKHPMAMAREWGRSYISFPNMLETRDAVHLNFHYNTKLYCFFYNKNTEQSLLFYTDAKEVSAPLAVAESSFVSIIYVEEKNPKLVFFDIKWD